MRLILIIFFVNLVWHTSSFGEDIEVFSSVDLKAAKLGQVFTYKITVTAKDRMVKVGEPRLPELKGFNLHGRSQGTSMSNVFSNGRVESQTTYEYRYSMSGVKAGKQKIGSAEVVVDGKVHKTLPIEVSILAGNPSPPSRPNRQAPSNPFGNDPFLDEAEELFSQLLRRRNLTVPGIDDEQVDADDSFFIQLVLDKDEVYVGEQVVGSWYLYTRHHIRDIDTLKYPDLKGFWKEDIEIATRLRFHRTVLNGLEYQRALLASYALFPINEGRIEIDPYKAKCTVVRKNFGSFGFGRPSVFTKSSGVKVVKVKPLPEEGKPENFSGAVGSFTVKSEVSEKDIRVGEPFTYKVRFDGKGNAKLIDLPDLNLGGSVEKFDVKSDAKFFRNGTSYKEFEVLLIPRQAGSIDLPGLKIGIFDPQKEKYEIAESPAIKIEVKPGKDNNRAESKPLVLSELRDGESEKDELPQILTTIGKDSTSKFTQLGIWSGVLFLAIGFLGYRTRKDLGWGVKNQTLKIKVTQRLSSIKEQVEAKDFRKVGIFSVNLLYYLLGEITGSGGADESVDKMLAKTPPSVRRALGDQLKKLLSDFETLGFAPESTLGDKSSPMNLDKQVKALESLTEQVFQLIESEEQEDKIG